MYELLPPLPLPTLEETCNQYLQTVGPMLSETEQTHTKSAVEKFLETDGRKLQKQLEMLASSTNTNYIHELFNLWLLQSRHSRASSSWLNYGLVFSPVWNTSISPLTIGAIAIHSLLQFYGKVRHHQLPPDQNIVRGQNLTLCMAQYDNIFGTSTIPGLQFDSQSQSLTAEHIIVIWQNKFYRLQVIKGEEILPVEYIKTQLEWITKQIISDEPALGVLTALPRTEWAILRSYLASISTKNIHSLSQLDTALFVVCLEDTPEVELDIMLKMALHGKGRNRWFDKSLQLIVTTGGQLATNHNHINMDGYAAMRLITEISHNLQNMETTSNPNSEVFEFPVPLEWSLTPEFQQVISNAEVTVDHLINQDQKQVWEFTKFGAEFFQQNNISGEAVVQLSLQLAYFRLHGEIGFSAQPVHIRHYRYGRFDDLRVMRVEFDEFMRTFSESNSDIAKIAALNHAVQAYRDLLINAKEGKNTMLHLSALHSLAHEQGEVPELFQDKSYTDVFIKPAITTSSLAAGTSIDAFGFGLCGIPSRYVVVYLVKQNKITFFITSRYEEIGKYIQSVKQSLLDIGRTITQTSSHNSYS